MLRELSSLAKRMEASFPDADVEFTSFPSGSGVLDVRHLGQLHVMSYSPSQGFGVDEVVPGECFLGGYRFTFDDIESAAEKLMELIARDVPV